MVAKHIAGEGNPRLQHPWFLWLKDCITYVPNSLLQGSGMEGSSGWRGSTAKTPGKRSHQGSECTGSGRSPCPLATLRLQTTCGDSQRYEVHLRTRAGAYPNCSHGCNVLKKERGPQMTLHVLLACAHMAPEGMSSCSLLLWRRQLHNQRWMPCGRLRSFGSQHGGDMRGGDARAPELNQKGQTKAQYAQPAK